MLKINLEKERPGEFVHLSLRKSHYRALPSALTTDNYEKQNVLEVSKVVFMEEL